MKESDIVDLFETIRTSIYATPAITEYLLNALVKLTTRFQQTAQISRIRSILSQNTSNLNVEIQQRAVEYENLFQFDDIRRGVLERMPAPEIREENRVLGEATVKKGKGARRNVPKPSAQKDLLDILGGADDKGDALTADARQDKNAELLKDLFGPSPSGTVNGGPVVNVTGRSNMDDIMNLFGSGAQGTAPTATPAPGLSAGEAGFRDLDDIFGRSAEPATTPTQKFGKSE